ncbi:nuclear factor NF-kappa-B family member relish isoform X2 [Amblyomma americanum]
MEEDDPYGAPLGNVAYPVSGEEAAAASSSSSAEQEQLRSFQDLLLRSFQHAPPEAHEIGMPICTDFEEQQNLRMGGGARLIILEQPMKETRYRYKSESGSHGPLIGESSTQQRKTFPTVKLENYNPELPHRIKASLVTAEDTARPHVHRITMRGRDEEDCCYVTVREDGRAIFPSMSIVFQQKKTVADILYRRKIESRQPSQEEARQLQTEAKKEAAELNLNLVRICFTAECCERGVWKPLCVAYSNPVANSKAGKLRITKANRKSGSCLGGDEVWILCEKINKKDILIKFFEEDEETRERTWEAPATFQESDVHYQVAIVFKTPAYRDTNLQRQVPVKFQLIRKSDNDCSEPFEFTYLPCAPTDEDVLVHKRPKMSQQTMDESSHLSGMMGPPHTNSSGGSSSSPSLFLNEPPFSMETSYPAAGEDVGDEPLLSDDLMAVLHENLKDFYCLLWEGSANPVLSQGMAADSRKLEESMRKLSLSGDEDGAGYNPCKMDSKMPLYEEFSSPSHSRDDAYKRRWCNAAGRQLGDAMYGLLCWLTKHLVKNCSTDILIKLVSDLTSLCDVDGNNALHIAVGHPSCFLETLLTVVDSTKKHLECVSKQNNRGQTPLHLSTLQGRSDHSSLLLVHGADVTSLDRWGRTVLHCAILGCMSKEGLKRLLSYRPKLLVNAADAEGKTAVQIAVEQQNEVALRVLCSVGADVNAPVDRTGDRALHTAVLKDFVDGVRILLAQDTIDTTAINSHGLRALDMALDLDRAQIIHMLLVHAENSCSMGQQQMDVEGGDGNNDWLQGDEAYASSSSLVSDGGGAEGVTPNGLRESIMAALDSEENAARVLDCLVGGGDAIVQKVVAFLKGGGLGRAIYRKYLMDFSDEALQRLFTEVLCIPLDA